MEYSGENLKVTINKDCSEILINNIPEEIQNVSSFSGDTGKIETLRYIIKYSKGLMYLFDKYKGQITETCKLVKTFDFNNRLTGDSQRFMLKTGYFIELTGNQIKYGGIYDNIVKVHKLGKDSTVYNTVNGNTLITSISGVNKWNGIPIGKV